MEKSCKKSAFTLAEVLITLGIIGIIAAITVPALMNNSNEAELKTGWKKAYSAASQAYMQALQENGGTLGTFGCNPAALNKFNAFRGKLNVVNYCDASGGGSILGKCWSSQPTSPSASSGCPNWIGATQANNSAFTTSDGMNWMGYGNSGGGMCPYMAVDINGNKGPNQFGEDVFTFNLGDTIIGNPGACTDNPIAQAQKDILMNK